ncbi:hypothetical protein ASAP_0192 [Asaia bogorensis]|uniref:Uncharacterized protein n=1 Tax=Asaia bogorensis TaxID=91915 RepID=A0A060QHJ2_9PROT|nr:hypothetical protein ASAP_0192 [Asaia bogorensis]
MTRHIHDPDTDHVKNKGSTDTGRGSTTEDQGYHHRIRKFLSGQGLT